MVRLIVALVLLFSAVQTQAEIRLSDVRLYGEARVGAGGVRHSELDFYPRYGSFSAGVFLFKGIGIEAFVDTPISAGESEVFKLEVTQAAGAAVRFQSPAQRGLQAYILLGYVDFTLKQQEDGLVGRRVVKQSFGGGRVSVGLQQRLKMINGLIFGVEYRNYYADSGITVDGISFGLRYEMP